MRLNKYCVDISRIRYYRSPQQHKKYQKPDVVEIYSIHFASLTHAPHFLFLCPMGHKSLQISSLVPLSRHLSALISQRVGSRLHKLASTCAEFRFDSNLAIESEGLEAVLFQERNLYTGIGVSKIKFIANSRGKLVFISIWEIK